MRSGLGLECCLGLELELGLGFGLGFGSLCRGHHGRAEQGELERSTHAPLDQGEGLLVGRRLVLEDAHDPVARQHGALARRRAARRHRADDRGASHLVRVGVGVGVRVRVRDWGRDRVRVRVRGRVWVWVWVKEGEG